MESKHDIHKLIDKASDVFYNKFGYEADIVFINKSYYLTAVKRERETKKFAYKNKYKNCIINGYIRYNATSS